MWNKNVPVCSNLVDDNGCAASNRTHIHTHFLAWALWEQRQSSMDAAARKEVSAAPAVGSSETLISANEDLQEVLMHVRGCT